MEKRLLRVLFLPADDGGCGWHRIRIFNEAFNRLEIADSVLLEPNADEKEAKVAIEYADVVVGRLNTIQYIKLIKKNWPSQVVVFDHDDNTLQTKPSNPAYKDFGTEDVWVPAKDVKETTAYKTATVGTKLKMEREGAIPLWVTGITQGFNRYLNLDQHMYLLWGLQACDLATSPVTSLTSMWGQYSDLVATVPNCLDFRYYPDVEVKGKKKEIRIGWSGGSSHSMDLRTIIPSIKKLAKKHDIKLVISGSHFSEIFNQLGDIVEFHPWTKWEAHPYRMKLLDLDFAIIPLADDEHFNKYKSELKMMEFAALKVPMIIKDQLPYSDYIKRGENCLAYKTEEELGKCLELMVKGKDKDKMVKNAYEWVRTHRDVEKIAKDLVKVYKGLLPEETQKLVV
jgi:glycosyltransferase involved in cell wall biosynthesis